MRRFFSIAGMVLLMAGIPLRSAEMSPPSEAVSTKPGEDSDADGLTNQEEAEAGTLPFNAYTDGDTVPDGQDAWALVTEFTFPRRPAFRYAVIPLGSVECVDINNLGVVLRKDGAKFENGIWGDPFTWEINFRNYSAIAINDRGDISGQVETLISVIYPPISTDPIWTSTACLGTTPLFGACDDQDIDNIPNNTQAGGVPECLSYGGPINNSGVIAGMADFGGDPGDQLSALWSEGVWKVLNVGELQMGDWEGAWAINDHGSVLAELDIRTVFSGSEIQVLLPQAFFARDLNFDDYVVGAISPGNLQAWHPNKGLIDLASSIPSGAYLFQKPNIKMEMVGTYIRKPALILNGKLHFLDDIVPEEVSVEKLIDLNDSGVVLARIDGANDALLLPVELVDTKDRVFDDLAPQGTTITAAMRDVNIEPKATVEEQKERSIAWIEPHGEDNGNNGPDMPQLALRFRGTEQMGLKIKWKLEVIYDRPRGTNPNEAQITAQDEVLIPKKASGTQPWKEEVLDGAVEFFNHADWIAALQEKGFFGGEVKLTYQLLKADGSALGTESTMLFSIGGKNPEDGLAKDYIDAKATAADARLTRLSYAVARHESKDYNGADSRYNQFWEGYARRFRHDHKRGHPLWCLSTGESSAGGFGIFQITGNLSSKYAIIPREQMWNWQKNTDAYITIIKTGGTAAKGSVMNRFIAAVTRTYPSDNDAQNPPTNFAYDGGNYNAWEMGTITLYNGAGGCPKSLLKGPSGKVFEPINPWKFFPSGAAGSRWRYHKNSNNYLHEVIEQR